MKESITTRVGRIISGSVNALVDAVENAAPEVVMEEALREIDSAVDEVGVELGKLVANKHLANTRLMEESKRHEDLAEKIELAIQEGRDDLAEAAISKQLDVEAQLPVLERTIAESAEQEKELEGYISALRARKREMQQELAKFVESRKQAGNGSGGDTGGSAASGNNVESKVAKATSAFERVLEKQTNLPANQQTDRATSSKLAELDDLARKNRISERLAAIKARKQ